MLRRRPLILIILLVVIAVLSGVVYLAFSGNGNSILGGDGTGSLPDVGTQAFPTQTSTTTVLGPESAQFGTLGTSPVAAYYVAPTNVALLVESDGRIAQVENGQTTVLSSIPITDLRSASFSSDGKKVLVVFGSTANLQVSVFGTDTKTRQPVTLPGSVPNPQWIPGTYDVLYATNDRATGVLRVLRWSPTRAGARPVEVLSTTAYDLQPVWDGPSSVLLAEPGSGATGGMLLQYSTQSRQYTPLLEGVPGLDVLWSAASHQGLLFRSTDAGRGGSLSVINSRGGTTRNLSFVTLPEKCTFTTAEVFEGYAGESVVCAVPTGADALRRYQLPDAWRKGALFTSDTFYAVRLDSGALKPIPAPISFAFDAEYVSGTNGKVFFRNRYDQRVYGVAVE